MKTQFTLTAVQPLADGRLHLTYADGHSFEVNISPMIETSPALAALTRPEIFQSARLGEWGGSVCFGEDDTLELAADNLRARAVEQRGEVSHEHLFDWLHRHQLTQQAAADALGLSRRMLAYYLSGAKPVPRTVALACAGWQAQQAQQAHASQDAASVRYRAHPATAPFPPCPP